MKNIKNGLIRIGFVNTLEHKAVRDCFSGILRFIANADAQWEVKSINPHSATDAEILQFANWKPVGIIAIPEFLSVLTARLGTRRLCRHATVFLHRERFPCRPANAMDISIDHCDLANAAASLLMKRGIEHFAYVDELERSVETERSKIRGDAFVSFLEKNGRACSRFTGAINGANWSSELDRLALWLADLPKPCGIMAYADICAKRIYDACHIARLNIPSQIRIVGVDNDISLCENLSPTLTSIEPDFEQCGYLAGQLLFDRLGESSPPKPMRLKFGTKSVIERASTQDIKGGGRIVTAACEIIRLRASEGISVSDVAMQLNVSRRLLEIRFREVLGKGVAHEIRRIRMENVCRWLRSTKLSIREIAAKSGFASESHLGASFRRQYGMSMCDWRCQKSN